MSGSVESKMVIVQPKSEKTNTFKNLGTFVGGAALIPATVRALEKSGATYDTFKNFIKTGPTMMDDTLLAAQKDGFGKKIAEGIMNVLKKSKGSRIAFLAGGVALVAGIYMGFGRLIGAIPDAIINKVRENKAQKPQIIY